MAPVSSFIPQSCGHGGSTVSVCGWQIFLDLCRDIWKMRDHLKVERWQGTEERVTQAGLPMPSLYLPSDRAGQVSPASFRLTICEIATKPLDLLVL